MITRKGKMNEDEMMTMMTMTENKYKSFVRTGEFRAFRSNIKRKERQDITEDDIMKMA